MPETAEQRAKALIDSLWNDKDLGAAIRLKAKEKFPDITIPDDQVNPFVAPLREENAALKARLDKFEQERADEKKVRDEQSTRQTLEQALDGARRKYSLTDEGFDRMVARMKETSNYSDAEAAAAWVAQQTPAAAPPTPTWAPKSMNLFGTREKDERFALLHRDPQEYQDRELADFVRDPDAYVRNAA